MHARIYEVFALLCPMWKPFDKTQRTNISATQNCVDNSGLCNKEEFTVMHSLHKGKNFLKVTFEVIVFFGLATHALEWAWGHWSVKTPELVWAYTVVLGFIFIYLFMFICFTKQAVLLTEIDAKAAQCASLEKILLKKRQSSKR